MANISRCKIMDYEESSAKRREGNRSRSMKKFISSEIKLICSSLKTVSLSKLLKIGIHNNFTCDGAGRYHFRMGCASPLITEHEI